MGGSVVFVFFVAFCLRPLIFLGGCHQKACKCGCMHVCKYAFMYVFEDALTNLISAGSQNVCMSYFIL